MRIHDRTVGALRTPAPDTVSHRPWQLQLLRSIIFRPICVCLNAVHEDKISLAKHEQVLQAAIALLTPTGLLQPQGLL